MYFGGCLAPKTTKTYSLHIALINDVIVPDVPITDVVVKNPFNQADYDGSKETILDVGVISRPMGTT